MPTKFILDPKLGADERKAAERIIAELEAQAPLYTAPEVTARINYGFSRTGEDGSYRPSTKEVDVYSQMDLGYGWYHGWRGDLEWMKKRYGASEVKDLNDNVKNTLLHEMYHARAGTSPMKVGRFFPGEIALRLFDTDRVRNVYQELSKRADELGVPSLQEPDASELAASVVATMDSLFGRAPATDDRASRAVHALRKEFPKEIDAFYFSARSPEVTGMHITGPLNIPSEHYSFWDSIKNALTGSSKMSEDEATTAIYEINREDRLLPKKDEGK